MKKIAVHSRSFLPALVMLCVLNGYAQQSFVHTATKGNNSCNGDCSILDVNELNDNPRAIIWATPVIEKGLNLNPHLIGVYYFQNQWRIMNLDQRPIPAGAKFEVGYLTSADEFHFQYLITPENIKRDGSAMIDHPAFNNNPTVQFQSFLSWDPSINRATTNRDSIIVQFNTVTGKWHISNINKKPLYGRVTYNMVIVEKGNVKPPPTVNNAVEIKELTITPAAPVAPVATAWGPVSIMLMSVWADGTKLPGDSIRAGYHDRSQLFGFDMNASILSASGQASASGKKSYDPVILKIHTGYLATVPLFDAFVSARDMVFLIEVFGSGRAGLSPLNYTIKLSGARIVGYKQAYETEGINFDAYNKSGPAKLSIDEIKVIFTKIEVIKGLLSVVDTQ